MHDPQQVLITLFGSGENCSRLSDMLLGLKVEASAPASRQQSRLKDKP
jgi:hypothetical protein